MQLQNLTHLSDSTLLHDAPLVAREERAVTNRLLSYIAEIDARGLYVVAGYSSMFAYCMKELGLSEDAANNRIHAARAARKHPALFQAHEEGRVHLTGIRMLAPYFTAENVEELISAATHRSKSDIERLIAQRFTPAQPLKTLDRI